ncbi:MAG: septum formation initiator family protein [Acidocella sp.]|nr:septum formation initiator family protein [Acidocella sp.]
MLKTLKSRLQALLPPAIFLAITWYFGWNALHGSRGMEAQAVQQAALNKANAAFQSTDASLSQWETQVADLSDKSIVRDELEEQARQELYLASPSDIVVQLPPVTTPVTQK